MLLDLTSVDYEGLWEPIHPRGQKKHPSRSEDLVLLPKAQRQRQRRVLSASVKWTVASKLWGTHQLHQNYLGNLTNTDSESQKETTA